MNELTLNRLDQILLENQIDALLCRLPEHIVYLCGTLPVLGASAVFYLPGKKPLLLHPECEAQWVDTSRCELHTFGWGHLGDKDLQGNYANWLDQLQKQFAGTIHSLSLEIDMGVLAPPYSSAELILADRSFRSIVAQNFPSANLMDAGPILAESRACKDADTIHLLFRVNRIAQLGLEALERHICEGLSEVEAAALVESAIRIQGTGYEGARLVKAYAQITSGPEGTFRQSMLTPSGTRKFRLGDLVMIELATCVDGLWSDLTRVYCVGEPSREQKRIFNAVHHAQKTAVDMLRPGNTWGSVDAAARKVLDQAGLGEYFKHGTGHGLGFRYHETIPQLGPDNANLLQAGMVTSVEPGVYLPGFGGIRIEDNIAVGQDGPVWLSVACSPW